MPSSHIRTFIYSGTLALLVSNGLIALYTIHFGDVVQNADPKLQLFLSMFYRYISIWNLLFVLSYTFLSLCCEINELMKGRLWRFSKKITDNIRTRMFCGVVWPFSVAVCAIFWPMYLYDREILLPKYTEVAISSLGNNIAHLVVIVIGLLELVYNPRKPEKHWENLICFHIVWAGYVFIVYLTVWQRGIYPYVFMNMISHTEVILFLGFVYLLCIFVYKLQWLLTPLLKYNKAKVFFF